eukprot:SAG11_NODE_268_length_11447_cov_3.136135_4_plen_178_part_00
MIPTTVTKTTTSQKKVTHIISIGDEKHFCTSASDVCATLGSLGHNITPAVVYRLCSKNKNRKHRNKPTSLPDNVRIARIADVTDGKLPEIESKLPGFTHVLIVDETKYFCTSALDVCEKLKPLGYTLTKTVVYRICSKNEKRQHKKNTLPDNVRIIRFSDYDENENVRYTESAPQTV